jgi:hypothetical protein
MFQLNRSSISRSCICVLIFSTLIAGDGIENQSQDEEQTTAVSQPREEIQTDKLMKVS